MIEIRAMSWEKYYSQLKKLPPGIKKSIPFVMKEIPRLKRQGVKHILDLGCGVGRPSIHLAEKGFEIVGMDMSKSALRMANMRIRARGLSNVAFVCGAVAFLPFRDACFDAVVSVSVIVHALKRTIEQTIAEIHRVTRKNGVLIINLTSINDPRCGQGTKLEENTYKITETFEGAQFEEVHHFFTRNEALNMFSSFAQTRVTQMKAKFYYWKVLAIK